MNLRVEDYYGRWYYWPVNLSPHILYDVRVSLAGTKERENEMEAYLDIKEALGVAEEAARHGGKVVKEQFGKTTHITMKREIEEQIPVDIESEKAILEVLERHFPHHNIHSEELGRRDRDFSTPG